MKIFIDESGIFAPIDKAAAWSTVGALTVPESSMPGLTNALRDLKRALGVDIENEIKKNRPDSNQSCFINFLKKLKHLNCTLHIATTNCSLLKESELNEHRQRIIQAINNFKEKQRSELSPEQFEKAAHHIDSTISTLEKIALQEYVQCLMQSYLQSLMIEKIIYFYSLKDPKTLSSFSWVIDQKSEKGNKFEVTYKNIMPGLIETNSVKRNKVLPVSAKTNYSYLKENYVPEDISIDNESVNYYNKIHNKDLTSIRGYLAAIDYYKILNNDMNISESSGNVGLQVVDLLVSSINRCLKGNFTNNKKMAAILGSLLLNSPRINEQAITMMILTNNNEPHEFDGEILKIIDENAIELYNENFRKNCTENLKEFEEVK
ncbi:DUF3800 domain-containing protein [Dickeya zeae]|uniref:DUF3800 domain-containing protein n=1 Tax=Dickeya zeae TaxID=204042 RepID=UPI001CF97862|nr:DUF3800 domain-containing protein [Dickeya zeae]UCZ75744.1 DUF3800 domain-containing protein [Dickeya zeae]